MEDTIDLSNEPILYELLEYFIRKQEPELIKFKNDTVTLPTAGIIKNILRYHNNRYSLPENIISQQINLTLPWKIAIGDYGRLLAVLQENVIEIRKAKDEYSSIIGKASVPKDALPQWRKLAWSPDGTILVLASSNGYISFYNSLGNNIFNINSKTTSPNPHILETGDAIASMIFHNPGSQNEKWSYEFILITYSGLLKSYHISLSNGYNFIYEFSFGNFYKSGVNAVAYDEEHSLLYVAGNAITQKLTSTASESGLTSWRLLNDYPYCKLSATFNENAETTSRFSLWNFIPTVHFRVESIIFNIQISPNNKSLICLHTDGSVSLWRLPNLVLQNKWKLQEQPGYNITNPLRLIKFKKFPFSFTEFHPIDVGWWSDQAIIIARYTGSISVCSIKNLNNLLGSSPEFLAGQPQICELGPNRGFLCLDCESYMISKKRNRESNTEGQLLEASSESEKESDELEHITILNYTTDLVQSTLYSITDMERFQPKRKRSKVLYRTYRILGLKSTTPEELYTRKIDIEEYEEALILANTYNLDTDLVYQTQWRKSQLSLNAIHEHLSKVTKRSWVLNECVTRVPDTIEAARELLDFGLKGANLETLLAIGECDDGKFVLADTFDDDDAKLDSESNLKQIQRINKIIESINVNNLSEAQKDLIKYRRSLLNHLDKLLTYEIILGPSLPYNKNFYEEFRQLSVIENAIRFAKDSDCRAVEIMFTYYGNILLPHWLAIISFFPETLNPLNYQKLLPHCDLEGQLYLPDQCELRQKDWSERKIFDKIINLVEDDQSQLLYETDPSLDIYKNVLLTPDLLQKWYRCRVYEIEKTSYMIDNALELVRIGKNHNIKNLEDLLVDLETLDDLVYKVYLDDMCLNKLEKLNDLEKIKLLMTGSEESNFVCNIQNLVIPFIKRRNKYSEKNADENLLHNYLVSISKHDLRLPVKLFEYLKQSGETDITLIMKDVVTVALDCIYACNDLDMYPKAKYILDTISKDQYRKGKYNSSFEELEREFEGMKILNKYGVRTTINSLHNNKSNPDAIKLLLTQMARSLNKLTPHPDEKQWVQLLNQMLEIHDMLFTCINIEICFEICVSAKLMSGDKSNIQTCSSLIETTKKEESLLKVSYNKAVSLIIEASKEYFNSSKSLTDPNMELAKTCLHLILDDNYIIREEYDLINSLQILNEFNVDMLPLQVRSTQDKLKLIEDCLNKREDAYKSRHRLLMLANYLHIEKNNTRLREGKVLELVAKKALQVHDYTTCAATCQQLMQINYVPIWAVVFELGCTENFRDLQTRRKCLWFAINNGPNDILIKALEYAHLIEVQILHENLQLWMPNISEDLDEIESEDEFIDAMSTPQVERKEFIPKVFETSTEIVKTSANIIKNSTYRLIKNIGNTDFWKSRLKFNFSNSLHKETQDENETNDNENINIQSFPCFYETLHKNERTSNLDTKYINYSMPEVQNTKLKLCRALLRISLLTETSCGGQEINDINHLLLECAKHTIHEDWLLSVAYLLSLNKTYISDIQSIFMNLPRNGLCIETVIYYYSLEFHKKLSNNIEMLYMYDPLSLISKALMLATNSDECDIRKALFHCKSYLIDDKKLTNMLSINSNEDTDNEKLNIPENSENIDEQRNIEYNNEEVTILDSTKDEEVSSVLFDYKDDEWADDWSNFSDANLDETVSSITQQEVIVEDKINTEEKRFKIFTEIYIEIKNIQDYEKVKNILLTWPAFIKSEFTTVDMHPILRMIKIIRTCIIVKDTVEHEDQILQEYKDLVTMISETNILREFLKQEHDNIPLNHSLHIRLCTDDPILHKEAIDILQKEKKTNLSLLTLKEIFLKNLTSCFEPDHEVYKQIIKNIFIKRSLPNIEENIAILIKNLIKQKHVMHALNIISMAENIPTSLSTFSTLFQLLTKK
ncbi:PREDICTED: neuroblastoma-amplified sequence-like isoform X1 [Polistes canadensis]|uniref:neuroblastoma-amplified sequence-like isoform X1 n=1 Tax=Polistes canadensis TaxID=91411 RepID=UPI000718B4C8|nr:PREDICTED: neuroblastoma-amplified sequence-like isoform X1 [Polistes canadensis]